MLMSGGYNSDDYHFDEHEAREDVDFDGDKVWEYFHMNN